MDQHPSIDPYIDEASGVLKNNLGITNPQELEEAEATAAAIRSYDIQENPPQGNFDLKHLQAIHKHLFGEVYPWAGELRRIDIGKSGDLFAHHRYIEKAGAPLFRELAKERHLAGLDRSAFSARAAHYMGEINALHPFREGNGRTQREFMGQLAQKNGFYIAWEQVTDTEMLEASREAFHREPLQLTALIEQNLHSMHVSGHEPAVSELSEASESFYARLSGMAEQKSAALDREAGDRNFDIDR